MKGKKNGKAKKIVLWVLLGYLLIMLVGYLGVSFYFARHFYNGSTINGVDCSGMTVDQVKEKIQESVGNYVLSIEEIDGKVEKMTAQELGISYVDDGEVDKLKDQQSGFNWISSFFTDKTYEMTARTSYEEETLEALLDNLSCFQESNIVAPEDAYIEKSSDGYVIVPEVVGNTLDREKVLEAVEDAVSTGKTVINLEELGCYVKPEVTAEEEGLKEQVESLSRITAAQVYFDFGEERIEKVDRALIETWLVKDGNTYQLDQNKVKEYVKSLSSKYDTYSLPHEFTTHSGKKITLNNGENVGAYTGNYRGDYGWCLDNEKTEKVLIDALQEGTKGELEPVWLYEAKNLGKDDIGGTYVEISIEEQTMWCYKDHELVVETPVTTGNPNTGHATSQGGIWSIDTKATDWYLEGEGYREKVKYWMPFDSPNDVGIHDLESRKAFGGDVYLTNGSHGCVNTPTDAVKKIFDTVEVGTAVVVY